MLSVVPSLQSALIMNVELINCDFLSLKNIFSAFSCFYLHWLFLSTVYLKWTGSSNFRVGLLPQVFWFGLQLPGREIQLSNGECRTSPHTLPPFIFSWNPLYTTLKEFKKKKKVWKDKTHKEKEDKEITLDER